MDFSTTHAVAAEARRYFNNHNKQTDLIHYQLSPRELIDEAIAAGEGVLCSTGALVINTGAFTGRSPKDRFIVKDEVTAETVNWDNINQSLEARYFGPLLEKMLRYIKGKKLYVRDCTVCAKNEYRLPVKVINENACANLFAANMFLPSANDFDSDGTHGWYLIHFPHFFADPGTDGVKNKNFVIISFTEKMILIGGTQYTGEIKKAIFSVLNFILPQQHDVLSMHCAANAGQTGDTALFFGLSGTGKTTLSADPKRKLIGDDEHGWDDNSIFNMEGGCYAKVINLDQEKEPAIFKAIRHGALLENVSLLPGSDIVNFSCKKITENTRVSYPLSHIDNALMPSVAAVPSHIFFLTADAFGVLPPLSKLTPAQAMYHFISGYTAKVAGTEEGISEPHPTFSACFGAPFMPLHPTRYAQMLGNKIKQHNVDVWLINTGWTGGEYGIGKRMPLKYTRAMIAAVLEGNLETVTFQKHTLFGLKMPTSCPGVPSRLLNPLNTWKNQEQYTKTADRLAGFFVANFQKYAGAVSDEILAAGPIVKKIKVQ
ncbi:MAG: phosphoenolpyruvate carboxykinase (ATP) [Ginsengibacter sp.]